MKKSLAKSPTLYDLFDPASLVHLERSITEGKIPNREELAAVLEANSERPLPAWFIATIIKSLRGELKSRPGRPKDHPLLRMRLDLAKQKYERYLVWLQKRRNSSGLQGWSAVRGKDWWKGPPHQRAARMVKAKWLKRMSWRAILNRVSSR